MGRDGPRHAVRISTHIYNTFAELDRLVAALEELRRESSSAATGPTGRPG